jgi:acetyltransferase-like isoleucine patch superfamily enzyme/acyl carrier protein
VYSKEELSGVLASTSICFDLSVFEIFGTLANGGKMVLVENALELLDRPEDGAITLINSVPSAMRELLALGAVPKSVRTVNLAGEPLTTELADAIYATGHVEKVYDLYGPSEDTTYSTYTLRAKGGPAIIGKPIANTQTYLLDANGQPVPIGVPGEVYLGGEGLARGYLHRPDLTAEKFVSNPFSPDPQARLYRTGDLAKYHLDGNLEFLGRIDHQVKVRGFRIELGEIEARIEERPEVDQTVVVAREEAPGDKQLVAYYTTHPGNALSPDDLRASLKKSLPVYMVPSFLVHLPAFPLTPNGKIDRKTLPQPENAPQAPVAVAATSAPAPIPAQAPTPAPVQQQTPTTAAVDTELERSIAQVWSEILGFQVQDYDGNFFEIGGHSLSSLRIVQLMNQRLGTHLSPMTLSQHQSIRALAELVRAEGVPLTATRQPAPPPAPLPPPVQAQPVPQAQLAPQVTPTDNGEIERAISQVWSEILGFEVQDYDGNFFEVGGHSLSALRALQLMNQRLGTHFSPMSISQHQTIRALADLVRAEKGTATLAAQAVSAAPAIAPAPVPTSQAAIPPAPAPNQGDPAQQVASHQPPPAGAVVPIPAPENPAPTSVTVSAPINGTKDEELGRLRTGLDKIGHARKISDRFAMRESWIAAMILRPLYRFRSPRFRRLLYKLIVKLEGDESTTRTLRRIWDEYYDVQVGDYTIGGFDLFRFRPGTSIGRYCSISRTARTETGNHPMNTLSTNAFFFNPAKNFTSAEFVPRVRLRIGNDVFLGHNVHVIAPTQEIGDGAVLGSGSIVMGNVPPFAVMMGYPAHVVRYRFSKDAIEEILKNPWWEKDLDELAAVKDEFTRPVEGKEVR